MADVVIALDDGTSFQHEFLARIIEGLECSATRVLYSPVNASSVQKSLRDYDIAILSDNDFEKLDNFLEEAVMNSAHGYFKIHVDVDDINTLNYKNTYSIHEISTDEDLGAFEIKASLGRNQERRLAQNQRLVLEKVT
ncbi:Oidioi.mRNA.OKI2018_I69.PAR.g10367.t1.cds [Oikopleura dioica]|uniref:Oidioi.mRNA.OKI2018_I69.PAR.g10367.t1.cds n=1 Tax=Oikopleura dioica TaxID=34765 RepID=A0ABN7RTQ9_OIKDI|nr:Oidioi.mRNA.OKI2018_I69.PAR.g10367.t1.cds [Oikopleura dioica]